MTPREMAFGHAHSMKKYFGDWMLNTIRANGVPDKDALAGFIYWDCVAFLRSDYIDASV